MTGRDASPDEHLAIALHHDRINDVVGSRKALEAAVQRTVCIKSCDPVAAHAIDANQVPPTSTFPSLCTANGATSLAPENPF